MVRQLRDGVWWVECTGVNAYLVADGDGVTLLDAGTPFDAARIEAAVDTIGFDRADIDRVLVTHYDIDHVGSLRRLGIDPETPVYIGAADAPLLRGTRRPRPTSHKPLTQLATGPLIRRLDDERVETVADGDEIGGFTAYHTPGHTPGHTVYVHDAREAAILGDMVVERGGELRPSPWILSYDTDGVRESIRRVARDAPAFEVAAMGHGVPFNAGGDERLRALADRV